MKAGNVSLQEFNKISESKVIDLEKEAKIQERVIEDMEMKKSDVETGLGFVPTNNGVVIAFQGERKTEGGIIVNKETDVDEPQLVLAVGPMVKEIKPLDNVIIRVGARPEPFYFNKKQYLYFREHDVLCIVDRG